MPSDYALVARAFLFAVAVAVAGALLFLPPVER